jgi:hypothetical protein
VSRREYRIHYRCARIGCVEDAWLVAGNRREEAEVLAHYSKNPWRCAHHVLPENGETR